MSMKIFLQMALAVLVLGMNSMMKVASISVTAVTLMSNTMFCAMLWLLKKKDSMYENAADAGPYLQRVGNHVHDNTTTSHTVITTTHNALCHRGVRRHTGHDGDTHSRNRRNVAVKVPCCWRGQTHTEYTQ